MIEFTVHSVEKHPAGLFIALTRNLMMRAKKTRQHRKDEKDGGGGQHDVLKEQNANLFSSTPPRD